MIKKEIKKNQKNTDEDIRQLVIARLKASAGDLKVSIGGEGVFTREDLIESVEEGNELGEQIIDIQMEYLRDLASGKIYQDEKSLPTNK